MVVFRAEKKTFTTLKFLRVSEEKKFHFYVGAVMYRYFALQIFIFFYVDEC